MRFHAASVRVSAPVRDRMAALTGLVRALDDAGVAVEDVALRRPTLDEVFLHLTGRRPDAATPPDPGTGTAEPSDAQEALA